MSSKVLVTLGMKCPRPLFEVHRTFKDLLPGDVLEVVADDPAFRLDIQAWCRRTGNDLVQLRSEPDRLVATIKKGEAP